MEDSKPEYSWRLPRHPLPIRVLCCSSWASRCSATYELDRIPLGHSMTKRRRLYWARQVASGQFLPIFIPDYTGHEVLYTTYHSSRAAVRHNRLGVAAASAAAVRPATVLAAYLLTCELLDGVRRPSRATLAWACSLLRSRRPRSGTSQSHATGYRAITLPMMQSLMLWALWARTASQQLEVEHRGRRACGAWSALPTSPAESCGRMAVVLAAVLGPTEALAIALCTVNCPSLLRHSWCLRRWACSLRASGDLGRADGPGFDCFSTRHLADDGSAQHPACPTMFTWPRRIHNAF